MKHTYTVFVIIAALTLGAQAKEHAGNIRTVIGVDKDLKEGELALAAGDHELAIKKLLSGLPKARSRHDTAMTLNNLCAAYSLAGDYDTSLEYCDRALRIKENAWQAHQNRARSLLGKGDIADAIAAVERGLEIAPDSVSLHQTLKIAQRMNTRPHVIIDTFNTDQVNQ